MMESKGARKGLVTLIVGAALLGLLSFALAVFKESFLRGANRHWLAGTAVMFAVACVTIFIWELQERQWERERVTQIVIVGCVLIATAFGLLAVWQDKRTATKGTSPVGVTISPEPYWFHLQFPHSGGCIEVPGFSISRGTQLDQNSCVNQTNEQWHFQDIGSGYYQINNGASNQCMNITENSTLDSAKVIQWDCDTHDNEYFRVLDSGRRVPFTYYLIQNVHSGKCLTVEAHSLNSGAKLIQSTCSPDLNNEQIRLFAGPETSLGTGGNFGAARATDRP